jgi:hypothetical protein
MAAALDTAPPDLSRMGRDGMARVRTRHHIDTEAAKLAALFARP